MHILLLLDYRFQFFSSSLQRGYGLDILRICTELERLRYTVSVKQFGEIDFQNANYKGVFVLYQSSEDTALKYKDYIEDVLLGLTLQGAILVPRLDYFRAHHNKVYMEILRAVLGNDSVKTLTSQCFGTYEEYEKFCVHKTFPIVFKPSAGARSHEVLIARNQKEADVCARKLSATPSLFNLALLWKNRFDRKGFLPISNHRQKFIVQPYIPNLAGDYKILVYGEKYFVLFRENRPNDFRASGGGRLSFPKVVSAEILHFAKQVYENFSAPFISIDVGYDDSVCYLFEFQFVLFGQYAIEQSEWHYEQTESSWIRVDGRSVAEKELAKSAHYHIQKIKEVSYGA